MKYELVNFSEIDKFAIKSYCAIHGEDAKKNMGNIEAVQPEQVGAINAIFGGSPCQDFSAAGKEKGALWQCEDCGAEYNPLAVRYLERDKCPRCSGENIKKTRSSLVVEFLRMVRYKKPKFGIYENVPALLNKNHKQTFEMFLAELQGYGYNVYFDVLNAKDYGIPQNRKRLYVVFVRKDVDNMTFKFPEKRDYAVSLQDVLEREVDEKYFYNDDIKIRFVKSLEESTVNAINKVAEIDLKTLEMNKRVYYDGISPALTTSQGGGCVVKILIDESYKKAKVDDCCNTLLSGERGLSKRQGEGNAVMTIGESGYCIRKLTPKEYFRLMGFNDDDFDSCVAAGISDTQLYKQAGNSIVVNVLYGIFNELYKAMPCLFDDLKVLSLFSGIGAFEKGLKLL